MTIDLPMTRTTLSVWHVCNVTERIIAVQGQFKVNQVVDFATNRKRVCDFLLVINRNHLSPFRRYDGLTVESQPRYESVRQQGTTICGRKYSHVQTSLVRVSWYFRVVVSCGAFAGTISYIGRLYSDIVVLFSVRTRSVVVRVSLLVPLRIVVVCDAWDDGFSERPGSSRRCSTSNKAPTAK